MAETADLIEAGRDLAPAEGRATPATMLALIARAATDPAVDVAKMEALLRMQRELEADQARAAFNAAYARLQARLPRITRRGKIAYPGKSGGKGSSIPFARWEDIDAAIRPLLIAEGFSLIFDSPSGGDGRLLCSGTLLHVDGHSRSASIPLPLDTSGGKNNLQAGGSAASYGQRYTTRMLLNLVFEGEDDDGAKGGAEYISAEQVKELSDLMRELAVNLDDFCRTLNVEALPDIQQAAYPVAINLLMARKARREGQS
ncbi:MAG TPA: ERF family protein [Stellaceae bacterium]|nr:ERF family protein [Stellaceae bacterium]